MIYYVLNGKNVSRDFVTTKQLTNHSLMHVLRIGLKLRKGKPIKNP